MVRVNHDRRGQRRNHFFRHLLRSLMYVVIFIAGQILQNHRKFIAAQTRHGIAGAHAGGQSCSDAFEQFVANIVAERIVDGFKAVKIDKHERKASTFSRGVCDALLKPVIDQHPIGQTRQRIARGQEFDAFFGAFAFGDVGRGTGHAQRTPIGVAFGDLAFRVQPHPLLGLARRTILALEIFVCSLHSGDQPRLEAFPVVRMVPYQNFFAVIQDVITVNRPRIE